MSCRRKVYGELSKEWQAGLQRSWQAKAVLAGLEFTALATCPFAVSILAGSISLTRGSTLCA